MLSPALGKALWISHQLQLGGSEGSAWAVCRVLAQKLLPLLRAAGGHRDGPPWALTRGTPRLCPAEGFCKEGKVSGSPGSMLCIQHSVKGLVLLAGRGHGGSLAAWEG